MIPMAEAQPSLTSGQCRYGTMTWPVEDAFIGRSLALYGEWAQNEIDFSAQFIKPDSVVLDVGSNIGTHAVAFSHLAPHGKVIAVEPQPQLFQILSQNIRTCAAGNVELIQAAAAQRRRQIFMQKIEGGGKVNFGGLSVLTRVPENMEERFDRVPCITIDSLRLKQLDFAKIDVEGFELSTLRGMTGSLGRCRPAVLCETLSLKSGMELIEWFSPLGYAAWFVAFSPFSSCNFKRNPRNEFQLTLERGLLFLPEGHPDPKPDRADSLERVDSVEAFAGAYLASVDSSRRIACRIYWGAGNHFSESDVVRFGLNEDRLGGEIDLTVSFSTEMTFSELCLAPADRRCIVRLIDSWVETDSGERKKLEPACSNEDDRRGDVYYWSRSDPQFVFRDASLSGCRSVGFRILYHQHGGRIDVSFNPLAAALAPAPLISQLYFATDHGFNEEESVLLHWTAGQDGVAALLKFQLPAEKSISSLYLAVAKTRCAIRIEQSWLEDDLGNMIDLRSSCSNERLRVGNTYYWLETDPQMHFLDFPAGRYRLACFRVTPLLHGPNVEAALRYLIDVDQKRKIVHTDAEERRDHGPAVCDNSQEWDFEKISRAIAADFDKNFYLDNNPDVLASGIDPVDHYVRIGWREGRDPHPEFSTAYYLELHPSVGEAMMNPFYHWILSGKPAGVASPGTYMQQILIKNSFLEPVDNRAWDGFECMPSEALSGTIADRLDTVAPRLVIAFGHDNYRSVVGGIQLCTALEQKAFEARRVTYLQVHPAVPAATLLPHESSRRYVMGIVVGGEFVGLCSAGGVLAALRLLQQRVPKLDLKLVVHALLGHSTGFLTELCEAVPNSGAWFWVHDYYSICPMYNLLRNNILYCNAPAEGSPACSTCIHGEERKRHRALMRDLFRCCNFEIIAPSRAALKLWEEKAGLPYKSCSIHEHASLIVTGSRVKKRSRKVRVAFAGLPRYHKGWQTYARLVTCLRDDPRYEFYLFGKEQKLYPPVEWREVSVSLDKPSAMTEALRREDIDVTVLWSGWPETFCIAAYESMAAGTFIVASHGSGNVAALACDQSRGLVFNGEDTLIDGFRSGRVAAAAGAALKKGLPTGYLHFSGMTADVVDKAGWE